MLVLDYYSFSFIMLTYKADWREKQRHIVSLLY